MATQTRILAATGDLSVLPIHGSISSLGLYFAGENPRFHKGLFSVNPQSVPDMPMSASWQYGILQVNGRYALVLVIS